VYQLLHTQHCWSSESLVSAPSFTRYWAVPAATHTTSSILQLLLLKHRQCGHRAIHI